MFALGCTFEMAGLDTFEMPGFHIVSLRVLCRISGAYTHESQHLIFAVEKKSESGAYEYDADIEYPPPCSWMYGANTNEL